MPSISGTQTNTYSVYDEFTGLFLFSIELVSLPHEGNYITYTPLSGPPVAYKVEKVELLTAQTSVQPGGEPPPPVEVFTKTTVKVVVSVIP